MRTREITEAQVEELFEDWLRGVGLRQLGKKIGYSYEGIRKRFLLSYGSDYSQYKKNIIKVIKTDYLDNKKYSDGQKVEIESWLSTIDLDSLNPSDSFYTDGQENNRTRYECGKSFDLRDSAPDRNSNNLYLRTI